MFPFSIPYMVLTSNLKDSLYVAKSRNPMGKAMSALLLAVGTEERSTGVNVSVTSGA